MGECIDIPALGSPDWKDPVSTFAALPSSGNNTGDARVTQDTQKIYVWSGSAWTLASGSGSNSFEIIQPPNGTSPTASSSTDTLDLTSSDSSITITGNSTTKTVDFKVAVAETVDGNSGSSIALNWGSNKVSQSVKLTANCAIGFSGGIAGGRYILRLTQDSTGSRTVTWPSSVLWPGGTAPTLTTTANDTDVIIFYCDGAYYYGHSFLAYPTPASWTPLSSANFQIVLESDVNVTNSSGNASQWVDQKSNTIFTQTTAANQPVINAAALNGLQTLTFNGTSSFLSTATVPYSLNAANAFSIYMVVKPSLTGYHCPISIPLSVGGGAIAWVTFTNDLNFSDYVLGSTNSGTYITALRSGTLVDATAFHVYKIFYNGAGLTLSNYGVQKDSATVVTPVAAGSTNGTSSSISAGARVTGSGTDSYFTGDIAAIYIASADTRPSGSNEDAQMMTYLQAKYGSGI